jgi:hypothetical protein
MSVNEPPVAATDEWLPGGRVSGHMAWVAWRQSRAALLGVLGVLALYAVMAVWERTHGPHFNGMTESFSSYLYLYLYLLLALLVGTPLVAREYDAGTYQLAWTQSVTRSQWLTARLAVNLGIGVLAAGVLHLFIDVIVDTGRWYSGPASDSLIAHGVLPYAQALCAIAWGVACGAALGRLLPALGVTLVGIVVQTAWLTAGAGTRPPFWPTQLTKGSVLVLVAVALIAWTFRLVARRA